MILVHCLSLDKDPFIFLVTAVTVCRIFFSGCLTWSWYVHGEHRIFSLSIFPLVWLCYTKTLCSCYKEQKGNQTILKPLFAAHSMFFWSPFVLLLLYLLSFCSLWQPVSLTFSSLHRKLVWDRFNTLLVLLQSVLISSDVPCPLLLIQVIIQEAPGV